MEGVEGVTSQHRCLPSRRVVGSSRSGFADDGPRLGLSRRVGAWTALLDCDEDRHEAGLPFGTFETWVRPIHAVGAVAGVLVLELPSIHFEGVDVRYRFNEYLVPELTQVRCVIAETLAA